MGGSPDQPGKIVLLRVIFGFLPLLVVALATRSLSWRDWRHAHHFLVMSVLAMAFYYFAFAEGTSLLLSSVAGMLSGAVPIFTFITALAILREEPINAKTIGGTVLGFLGVLLIARPWNHDVASANLAGVFWMIAWSFSLGFSFVYARKFVSPLKLMPLALTTYQIGLALAILALTTPFRGIMVAPRWALSSPRPMWHWPRLHSLLRIVGRLGAIAASGVTYLPPVVALVIGAAVVGEPVRVFDLVGMAAILTGVAVLQWGRSK
jgi:drug/metabolite transporter (DMT)-like permease